MRTLSLLGLVLCAVAILASVYTWVRLGKNYDIKRTFCYWDNTTTFAFTVASVVAMVLSILASVFRWLFSF